MAQIGVLRENSVERKNGATGNAKDHVDALFEERFADYLTTSEVLGHIYYLARLPIISAIPSYQLQITFDT